MKDIDQQIKEKSEELKRLVEIKNLEGKDIQSVISKIVATAIEETNRFMVVNNSTYWDDKGVKIHFNRPTATWSLAEKIIKAGYHISQIDFDGQSMFWIVTEKEVPERN